MIQVIFLAQLREQLNTATLEVDPAKVNCLSALKTYLVELHPEWSPFLANKKLLVALNHEYVRGDVPLTTGDEVAFFPPVTGG